MKLKVDLTSKIQELEIITRDLVTTKFIGNYRSVFKGKGLEFADYRDYTKNDDASLIDWKASVRANKTLIKEFVEERDLNVFFIVDAGSSMMLGSTPKLKNEYAAELIASLSYAMLKSGDAVGMVLFTNKVVKQVPCTKGLKQFYILLETLVDPKLYGGPFNLSEALTFALSSLEGMSLLIIVSDFITTKNHWQDDIGVVTKKFDTIGFMIRDPRDLTLPKGIGQVVVSDPVSGEKIVIEPGRIGGDYENETKTEINSIKKVFFEAGSDLLMLPTNKPFVPPLIKLFEGRKRRWK